VGVWISSRFMQGTAGHEAASELEEHGFDALWLGSSRGDLSLIYDLLGATSRLVVATGIVNVWTEPAERTAAASYRVTQAFPDRLLLGIGAGHRSLVEAKGLHYGHPFEKVVSYLDELDAADPPIQPRDRILAALGPRMLALAADRSAGAFPYLVTPEHTRRAREIIGTASLLTPEQTVVLETDPYKARAIAREGLASYLGLPNYTNNWLRLGFTEDDLASGGSDRLVDALVAWGDAATVCARIQEHYQAGADHVCIQVLTGKPEIPLGAYSALAKALRGSES
jgi:probable F420-dependent oxidoreductase